MTTLNCPTKALWPGQLCPLDPTYCCDRAADPNNKSTWTYEQWIVPEGATTCGKESDSCKAPSLCTSRFTNRAICTDDNQGIFQGCMDGFTQIFNVDANYTPMGLQGSFGSNPPATQSICQPTMNMEDIVNKYVGKAWGDGARNDYLNNNNNRIDECISWNLYGGKYFTQSCAADITDPSGTWYKEVVAGKVGHDGKPIDLETGMLGKTRCSYPFYAGNDADGSGCWHLTYKSPDPNKQDQNVHLAMGLGDNYFNGSMDGSQSGYRMNDTNDGHHNLLNTDGVYITRVAEKKGEINNVGPGDCTNEGNFDTPWNDGQDCSNYV